MVSCAFIGLAVLVFMEFGWKTAAFGAELVRHIVSLRATSYDFLIEFYWPFLLLANFLAQHPKSWAILKSPRVLLKVCCCIAS